MKLDITIQLQHPIWKKLLRPYGKTIRAVVEAALMETKLGRADCTVEMAVVLADDAFIQTLNREYRGQDKPTNVLSFPSGDLGDFSLFEKGGAQQTLTLALSLEGRGKRSVVRLGDVVLAQETLAREALEQRKNVKNHAVHLLVHGILHLLGHDHMEEKDATRMEKLEIKILKKQGISNPYM